MSDLISREDVMGAVQDHFNADGFKGYDDGQQMMDRIMALPSADAVEVVRCKDCKHRRDICSMRYIEMVGEDERIHDYSTDNGYCSWGERREDGEE